MGEWKLHSHTHTHNTHTHTHTHAHTHAHAHAHAHARTHARTCVFIIILIIIMSPPVILKAEGHQLIVFQENYLLANYILEGFGFMWPLGVVVTY